MTVPSIGVIISSTREKRFGEKMARWVLAQGASRADLRLELVDLRDYPLPRFEGGSPAFMPVTDEVAKRWGAKLAELDGFVFVCAEYNHSITGALKNAIDWAYHPWVRKPAAFVGYGSVGAARAVEHLRGICAELQMAPLRFAVHLSGSDARGAVLEGKPIEDVPSLGDQAKKMFDDLAWWSKALKAARAS